MSRVTSSGSAPRRAELVRGSGTTPAAHRTGRPAGPTSRHRADDRLARWILDLARQICGPPQGNCGVGFRDGVGERREMHAFAGDRDSHAAQLAELGQPGQDGNSVFIGPGAQPLEPAIRNARTQVTRSLGLDHTRRDARAGCGPPGVVLDRSLRGRAVSSTRRRNRPGRSSRIRSSTPSASPGLNTQIIPSDSRPRRPRCRCSRRNRPALSVTVCATIGTEPSRATPGQSTTSAPMIG